ncbi:MAG: DegT/DnrJ/EryC1/StrS family aminotransferase [Haliangiales bacterium]
MAWRKRKPGRIPLARPTIGDAEVAAAERTLRSGRLVLGYENERFEHQLARATGRAHGLCVTSGTTALELALWVTPLLPGHEVVMPAAGYPAALHAALRLTAQPVLVDIDPLSWTLDVELAAAAVAASTAVRALVSVDTLGVVAESRPLERLCGSEKVALISDAACSLGGTDSAGKPGASYGLMGILSFHPRKVITTGEGGAIVCTDNELIKALRGLRNHGQSGPGEFFIPGTNARMPEMAASIGSVQLDRLDSMLRERELLVAGYQSRLEPLRAAGKLSWQEPPPGARPSHQTFAVLLADNPHLPSRDQVRAYLAQADIESQIAVYALHQLGSVRGYPGIEGSFPVTEALAERGLALPLYIGMRSAELDRVCDTLAEVLR